MIARYLASDNGPCSGGGKLLITRFTTPADAAALAHPRPEAHPAAVSIPILLHPSRPVIDRFSPAACLPAAVAGISAGRQRRQRKGAVPTFPLRRPTLSVRC